MVWRFTTILVFGFVTSAALEQSTNASERSVIPLRKLRVLVAKRVNHVRVQASSPLIFYDRDHTLLQKNLTSQAVTIKPLDKDQLRIGLGQSVSWEVMVEAEGGKGVTLHLSDSSNPFAEGRTYPGSLRVVVREDQRLDVINEVDVETYVGCVVAGEVWPNFEREALRAQAIAARTFVLFQMQRRNLFTYDVVATQGAQVYTGLRGDTISRRAAQATLDTQGLALTWKHDGQEQLFSAYYSAVCGGVSQSASIFGQDDDIKPLSGGVKCTYCKIAPGDTYRWGPVRMPLSQIGVDVKGLLKDSPSPGSLKNVRAIEQTEHGRVVRVRLDYEGGETRDLLAERFRLAVNGNLIKSTDFQLSVKRRHLIFENGKGFGHGLGLCQWGMQGQALEGRRAGEILRYYYPGSKITRVY